MQYPCNASLAACLQDVQGALDIGAHVAGRRLIRIRNGDERGKVKNDLTPFDCVSDTIPVANVSGNHLYLVLDLVMIQPPPSAEGIVILYRTGARFLLVSVSVRSTM